MMPSQSQGPWLIYIEGEDGGSDIYLQMVHSVGACEHVLNAVPMLYPGRRAYAVPYQAEVRAECRQPRNVKAEIAKWQRAYDAAVASRESKEAAE